MADRAASVPSGDLTLHAGLHTPEGAGPFPAMIWNHGSERLPGPVDELADFYTAAGYVLCVPHRSGHGRSEGDYAIASLPQRAGAETQDPDAYRRRVVELVIELCELQLRDVVAAADWLREQPPVDPTRMFMSGVSHGGILTLLAAEADVGMKAYVPFAPGAMAWQDHPELRDRLLRAVQEAATPVFLVQAQNDYSLGPSETLGAELERKGAPNQVRVYPPFGATHESGHGEFAWRGMDVWGRDVCAFMDQVPSPTSAA